MVGATGIATVSNRPIHVIALGRCPARISSTSNQFIFVCHSCIGHWQPAGASYVVGSLRLIPRDVFEELETIGGSIGPFDQCHQIHQASHLTLAGTDILTLRDLLGHNE